MQTNQTKLFILKANHQLEIIKDESKFQINN